MRRARSLGGLCLAAVVLAGTVLAGDPASADGAAPSLAGVMLTSPLPGFVADPPGPTNGAITPANADQPGLGSGSALLAQLSTDGQLTSFVRTWHDAASGDGIDLIATRFQDADLMSQFLREVAGAQRGTRMRVAGDAAAEGYATFGTFDGLGVADYVVTFTEGDTVFVLAVVTRGDLTAFNAVKVAQVQADAASAPAAAAVIGQASAGPRSWLPSWHDALWLALLAAGVLVAAITLAGRRRPARPAPVPAHVDERPARRPHKLRSRSPQPMQMPRRRPADPGWVYLEGNLNVQCYWDGDHWTQRREWDADERDWVSIPLAPLEPTAV